LKHTKAFVIVALAAVAVAGSFLFLRPAKSPTAPSDWMLQAATALNRVSSAGNPHGGVDASAGDPSSAQQLALEGQRLRVQRRFAEAQAVYQQAVRADPMNADAWADLADSAASAAGNDLTQGRDAIARGLLRVLDGGRLTPSSPSTVVDCTGRRPRVIRPGAIPAAVLRESVPNLIGDA